MQQYPQSLSAFESFIVDRVRKLDEWNMRKQKYDLGFMVVDIAVLLFGIIGFFVLVFSLHLTNDIYTNVNDRNLFFYIGVIFVGGMIILFLLLFQLKSHLLGEAPVIPGGAKLFLTVVKPDTIDIRQEGGEYYHPRNPH